MAPPFEPTVTYGQRPDGILHLRPEGPGAAQLRAAAANASETASIVLAQRLDTLFASAPTVKEDPVIFTVTSDSAEPGDIIINPDGVARLQTASGPRDLAQGPTGRWMASPALNLAKAIPGLRPEDWISLDQAYRATNPTLHRVETSNFRGYIIRTPLPAPIRNSTLDLTAVGLVKDPATGHETPIRRNIRRSYDPASPNFAAEKELFDYEILDWRHLKGATSAVAPFAPVSRRARYHRAEDFSSAAQRLIAKRATEDSGRLTEMERSARWAAQQQAIKEAHKSINRRERHQRAQIFRKSQFLLRKECDPDALAACDRVMSWSSATYAAFAHGTPEERRATQDAARAYPALLNFLLQPPSHQRTSPDLQPAARRALSAIARGDNPTEVLAEAFKTTPNAVRRLHGLTPARLKATGARNKTNIQLSDLLAAAAPLPTNQLPKTGREWLSLRDAWSRHTEAGVEWNQSNAARCARDWKKAPKIVPPWRGQLHDSLSDLGSRLTSLAALSRYHQGLEGGEAYPRRYIPAAKMVAHIIGKGAPSRLAEFDARWHRGQGALLDQLPETDAAWLPLVPPGKAIQGVQYEFLTTERALRKAGREARHCVGGYTAACLKNSHVARLTKDGALIATLELQEELSHDGKRTLQVAQCRASMNTNAPPEAQKAAEWLAEQTSRDSGRLSPNWKAIDAVRIQNGQVASTATTILGFDPATHPEVADRVFAVYRNIWPDLRKYETLADFARSPLAETLLKQSVNLDLDRHGEHVVFPSERSKIGSHLAAKLTDALSNQPMNDEQAARLVEKTIRKGYVVPSGEGLKQLTAAIPSRALHPLMNEALATPVLEVVVAKYAAMDATSFAQHIVALAPSQPEPSSFGDLYRRQNIVKAIAAHPAPQAAICAMAKSDPEIIVQIANNSPIRRPIADAVVSALGTSLFDESRPEGLTPTMAKRLLSSATPSNHPDVILAAAKTGNIPPQALVKLAEDNQTDLLAAIRHAADETSRPAFHLALAETKDEAVIRTLMQAGADPFAKVGFHNTVADFAISSGDSASMKIYLAEKPAIAPIVVARLAELENSYREPSRKFLRSLQKPLEKAFAHLSTSSHTPAPHIAAHRTSQHQAAAAR